MGMPEIIVILILVSPIIAYIAIKTMNRKVTKQTLSAIEVPEKCPLCGRDKYMGKKTKILYGIAVCRNCYYSFANNRQLAYFLDQLLYWGLMYALGYCIVIILRFAGTAAPQTFYQALGWLLFPIFAMKDGSSNGSSPGKMAMGIQVLDIETGKPIGLISSLKRNLILIIPIVPLIVGVQLCKGYRSGDGWAKTRVIWKKYADRAPFAIGNAVL